LATIQMRARWVRPPEGLARRRDLGAHGCLGSNQSPKPSETLCAVRGALPNSPRSAVSCPAGHPLRQAIHEHDWHGIPHRWHGLLAASGSRRAARASEIPDIAPCHLRKKEANPSHESPARIIEPGGRETSSAYLSVGLGSRGKCPLSMDGSRVGRQHLIETAYWFTRLRGPPWHPHFLSRSAGNQYFLAFEGMTCIQQ
jgi:hypothetical protein